MNLRRCLFSGLLTVAWLYGQPLRASVAPAENPYTPIVERNVFGLVPIPPPPVAVDPATLVPPPKITPNGIMTLFGKLQVLFKVAGVTHPGLPPKDESYVMCEGDRQDDIEVQKIDQPSATITFNNHGVVQVLPLVASTGGTVASPPPGAVPPPGMPGPGMAPGNGPHFGFGGRFGRGRGVATGGNPNAGAPPEAAAAPVASEPAPEAITPENQIIMIEAQRMKALQEGDPVSKILPITPLTSQVTGNPADEIPAPAPGD
jgi:hypothetical protein